MSGNYLNNSGFEIPENKIVIVPHSLDNDGWYKEVIKPLKGETKRDWFNSHFYYCLPLTIGNQYGFVINSLRDFEASWDGTDSDAIINFLNNDNFEEDIKIYKLEDLDHPNGWDFSELDMLGEMNFRIDDDYKMFSEVEIPSLKIENEKIKNEFINRILI